MFTPTSAARSSEVCDATSLSPGAQSDPYPYAHGKDAFVVMPNTFSDANELIQGHTAFGNQIPLGSRMAEPWQGGGPGYHVEARLTNGKMALLLDIGSVGNLAGGEWAQRQASAAMEAGMRPE